ncbi:MAG TPA: hypothetical protein VGB78_06040 [Thermoplasmata archaeon]
MSKILTAKKKHLLPDDAESPAVEYDRHRPKAGTVRVEVKHLRRVVKRGERALKHMSEALEPEKMTERDLSITKEVLSRALNAQVPVSAKSRIRDVHTFTCFECGARIPSDSVRCPKCDVLYIKDPKGEAIDESVAHEDGTTVGPEDTAIFKVGVMAFAHIDMTTGVITCLKTDGYEADCGLECGNCGAVTLFGTDRCPLCGHDFDEDDAGLVCLFKGLKFDLDGDKELDCPSCGNHVVADRGVCPACKEVVGIRNDRAPDAAVLPLLNEKDVVFVHLDARNDDLWFARKVKFKKKMNDQVIHLESVTKSYSDYSWQSLARI